MIPPLINGVPLPHDPFDVRGPEFDAPPIPDDREAPLETDVSAPDPSDADGPRYTFPELIDQEAIRYRSWQNPVGDFLAGQMEELAQMVRFTHAKDPAVYEDRIAVMEEDRLKNRETDDPFSPPPTCRCGDDRIV